MDPPTILAPLMFCMGLVAGMLVEYGRAMPGRMKDHEVMQRAADAMAKLCREWERGNAYYEDGDREVRIDLRQNGILPPKDEVAPRAEVPEAFKRAFGGK